MVSEKKLVGVEDDLHEWLGTKLDGDLEDAIVVLSRTLVLVYALYCTRHGVVDPVGSWTNSLRELDKGFMPMLVDVVMDEREEEELTH